MHTVLQMLNLRPMLLKPGDSIRIALQDYAAVYLENLGMGPRGFPAISIRSHVQDGSSLVTSPEIRFEITIVNGSVTAVMPYFLRDDATGLKIEAVMVNGTVDIDRSQLQRIQTFAAAWDKLLEAHGLLAAYVLAVAHPEPATNDEVH